MQTVKIKFVALSDFFQYLPNDTQIFFVTSSVEDITFQIPNEAMKKATEEYMADKFSDQEPPEPCYE